MSYSLQVLGREILQRGVVETNHVSLQQHHQIVILVQRHLQTLVILFKLHNFEVVESCYLRGYLSLSLVQHLGTHCFSTLAAPPLTTAVIDWILGQEESISLLTLLKQLFQYLCLSI